VVGSIRTIFILKQPNTQNNPIQHNTTRTTVNENGDFIFKLGIQNGDVIKKKGEAKSVAQVAIEKKTKETRWMVHSVQSRRMILKGINTNAIFFH